jgi:dual-specificity kinase
MDLTHADLKPENILLSPDSLNINLVDFGLAVFSHEHHTPVVGTRQYSGPEVILELGWSHSLDIWSAGCLIAELYLGRPLFETHENMEHLALMEKILGPIPTHILKGNSDALKYFKKELTLNWPHRASSKASEEFVAKTPSLKELIPEDDLRGLITSMLRYDPSKRVSASVALQHEFLQEKSAL